MTPDLKDTPENVAYRTGELERKYDAIELRVQAQELWKAKVEEKVDSINTGGEGETRRYAPTATQWLKVIGTILALVAALIGYITQIK